LDTGASGYIVKADAGNELAKAVEAVFQGKRYISSRLNGYASSHPEDTRVPDRLVRTEVLAWPSAPALPKKKGTWL
jgi:DNA-binding NarL/FixJ family response regulator